MSIDPKHNEDRIRSFLANGPMTTRELQTATGMSNPGVLKRLRSMEGAGKVVLSRCGPYGQSLLWALDESNYDDHDEPLHKRKKGFGSNPPGEALVKAWGG
jgi:DNA-binding Lrp family transcriptional regulator